MKNIIIYFIAFGCWLIHRIAALNLSDFFMRLFDPESKLSNRVMTTMMVLAIVALVGVILITLIK